MYWWDNSTEDWISGAFEPSGGYQHVGFAGLPGQCKHTGKTGFNNKNIRSYGTTTNWYEDASYENATPDSRGGTG
jgi:hypothetical protein